MYVHVYIYIYIHSSMKGYVKLSGSCSAQLQSRPGFHQDGSQTSHLPLLNSIPTQPTTCKSWRPPKGLEFRL